MTVHVMKCWCEPFAAIVDGSKPFEWRSEADREFEVGDLLILLEWRPAREYRQGPNSWAGGPGEMLEIGYTGEVAKRRVTYVLRERFGVPKGYAVLGLGAP